MSGSERTVGDRASAEPRDADDSTNCPLGWTDQEFRDRFHRLLAELGEPAYRERQLRKWIWSRDPADFAAMSDLPGPLRRELDARLVLHPLALRERLVSRDGTQKFLWRRTRGEGDIESVSIPDGPRIAYCISSQAGCPVKCPFCATGHGGFQGQLSAGEIIDQVVQMRSTTGTAPTNIVFMGMGEPLLNFEAVLQSLAILTDPNQVGLGARRVTVSTVGIPERIRELSRRFPQVKIALSLHAPRDELRGELVPLNTRYPLGEVLAAVRDAVGSSGRLATMEYVMLPGVNDSDRDADDLARLLRGLSCRVNLIGFNPFPGAEYEKPSVNALVHFQRRLAERFSGPVTIRRPRGDDIQGACGQLRLHTAREAASR